MDPAKKKERVDALLANKKLPFTDADRAFLEAKDEAGLTALEAHAKTLEPAPAATPQTPVVQATAQPTVQVTPQAQTLEQYISGAPAEIAEVLSEGVRVAREQRDGFVALLKGSGRCDLTDAQLAAYNTAGLAQLVKLAGLTPGQPAGVNSVNPPAGTVVSFAGRGVPRPQAAQAVSEPPDLVAQLQQNKAAAK